MSSVMQSAGPASRATDTMVAARPEQLYTHTTEPRAVGQRKPKVSTRVWLCAYGQQASFTSAALVEQSAAGNDGGAPDWLCLLASLCGRSLGWDRHLPAASYHNSSLDSLKLLPSSGLGGQPLCGPVSRLIHVTGPDREAVAQRCLRLAAGPARDSVMSLPARRSGFQVAEAAEGTGSHPIWQSESYMTLSSLIVAGPGGVVGHRLARFSLTNWLISSCMHCLQGRDRMLYPSRVISGSLLACLTPRLTTCRTRMICSTPATSCLIAASCAGTLTLPRSCQRRQSWRRPSRGETTCVHKQLCKQLKVGAVALCCPRMYCSLGAAEGTASCLGRLPAKSLTRLLRIQQSSGSPGCVCPQQLRRLCPVAPQSSAKLEPSAT